MEEAKKEYQFCGICGRAYDMELNLIIETDASLVDNVEETEAKAKEISENIVREMEACPKCEESLKDGKCVALVGVTIPDGVDPYANPGALIRTGNVSFVPWDIAEKILANATKNDGLKMVLCDDVTLRGLAATLEFMKSMIDN